jgi:hypothetical protein
MLTNLECSEKPIKAGNEKCVVTSHKPLPPPSQIIKEGSDPVIETHRDGGVTLNDQVKKNNFFGGLIASFKANLSFLKTKKAVDNFKEASEKAIGLHNPAVQKALIAEYNLIVEKKSKLSAKERKYVSNKIEYMINEGIIKKV